MKPQRFGAAFSIVLAATIFAWCGRAQSIDTNSPAPTQLTPPNLQTWTTISNQWSSVSPSRIKEAAAQGDASAELYLGQGYFDGIQLVRDPDEAMKWIKRAAEKGWAAAEHNLAWRYAHGDGMDKDRDQAIAWYQKAADQGFVK